MRFYKDIIEKEDQDYQKQKYHYWSPDSIKNYWAIAANNYFIRSQFYPLSYWEDIINWANAFLDIKSMSVLDVGCGIGNMIKVVDKKLKPKQIKGLDLSEKSLGILKKEFSDKKHVDFIVGSIDKIPCPDNSFDLIVCTEVLEHTFKDVYDRSYSEIKRALKPGGYYLATIPIEENYVVVCCPNCQSIFSPYQHMIYEVSIDDIKKKLKENELEFLGYYEPLDASIPKTLLKRIVKKLILNCLPSLSKRLFPKAGTRGFLARKR